MPVLICGEVFSTVLHVVELLEGSEADIDRACCLLRMGAWIEDGCVVNGDGMKHKG